MSLRQPVLADVGWRARLGHGVAGTGDQGERRPAAGLQVPRHTIRLVASPANRRPRPIALCVVWRRREILVFEGRDPVDGRSFYRPLGGGVEWRELSRAAVARELQEELGTDLEDVRLLGVLENVFTYAGTDLHEIAFIYEGRLSDGSLYERDRLLAVEAGGDPLTAVWMPVERFGPGGATLYPDGLLELVREGTTSG